MPVTPAQARCPATPPQRAGGGSGPRASCRTPTHGGRSRHSPSPATPPRGQGPFSPPHCGAHAPASPVPPLAPLQQHREMSPCAGRRSTATAAQEMSPAAGRRSNAAGQDGRMLVAVRVRSDGDPPCISCDEARASVQLAKTGRELAYDDVFCGGQDQVYQQYGRPMIAEAFQGYHCCLFAYGQTGSGKSYSMIGDIEGWRRSGNISMPVPGSGRRNSFRINCRAESRGVLIRACEDLWERVSQRPDIEYHIEVSFYQIYLEKVQCLLNFRKGKSLRVREHPATGPYVEDLSTLSVRDYESMLRLIEDGNRVRRVSNTRANHISSRSHAVFCINITQSQGDRTAGGRGAASSRVSKVSLVDLAGSERVVKTGATGQGLVEAGNINQSLTTLGKVISTLYEMQTGRAKCRHVPYRDSALTWLLKESLGGNSFTTMLSTISPSEHDYEETLSTLRYSDQAKRIVNKAVVNENNTRRIISQLKSEIRTLQEQLARGADQSLAEQLDQSQKLMDQMSRTWEEKWEETQCILRERELEAQRLQAERDEARRLLEELQGQLEQEKDLRGQEQQRVKELEDRLAELTSGVVDDDWPADSPSEQDAPRLRSRRNSGQLFTPLQRNGAATTGRRCGVERDSCSSFEQRTPPQPNGRPAASRPGAEEHGPRSAARGSGDDVAPRRLFGSWTRPTAADAPHQPRSGTPGANGSSRVRAPTPVPSGMRPGAGTLLRAGGPLQGARPGAAPGQQMPNLRVVFDGLAKRYPGEGAARKDFIAALQLRTTPGGTSKVDHLLQRIVDFPGEALLWEDFRELARLAGIAEVRSDSSSGSDSESDHPRPAVRPARHADPSSPTKGASNGHGRTGPGRLLASPLLVPAPKVPEQDDFAREAEALGEEDRRRRMQQDQNDRWQRYLEARKARLRDRQPRGSGHAPSSAVVAMSPPRNPERPHPDDREGRSSQRSAPSGRHRRSRSRICSSSDEDRPADSDEAEFRRRCRVNTREAIRESERVRQRIDDDWRKQQLGLPVPDRGGPRRVTRGGLRCRFAAPHVTERTTYDAAEVILSDDSEIGRRRRR
eukprot:TRINITY_DN211_c3_g3_i2.p1 TRINITY_DN211_c3_g3~~TRINITY_DN211_c3_g3_i2.p1  ORF type:complete len:1101 (+),score=316.70 TRINITY_DN211_c3_g3_i2:103-3303(+)